MRKEDITARVDDEGSSVTIGGTFPERPEGELKHVYGERRVEAGAAFARTIPLPGPVAWRLSMSRAATKLPEKWCNGCVCMFLMYDATHSGPSGKSKLSH